MSQESQERELERYNCTEPEWFMRSHIPRYAEHFGLYFDDAYERVLQEIVAVDKVRNENFEDLVESGIARKVLMYLGERGLVQHVGERPLIVTDNRIYRMTKGLPEDSNSSSDWTEYDPLIPLTISNFQLMTDRPYVPQVEVVIGRPNSHGKLWLGSGMDVGDYDVVVNCFQRLVDLRLSGEAPHLESQLPHVFIPFTLGDSEHPYSPDTIRHDSVEYHGLAAA